MIQQIDLNCENTEVLKETNYNLLQEPSFAMHISQNFLNTSKTINFTAVFF